jgi:Na+/glutamate symporter
MSAHGFHVHGPHDHELEHAAEHGHKDPFAGRIAVTTAVLATAGALFGYMGGATQANATLYKNNAAIKKTEASNQWNHYQAKSSRQSLSELALVLVPENKKAEVRREIDRYKAEKAEIQEGADRLEAEARDWEQRSEVEMHRHHRWAQATTTLQVAIAMAAMTLLTRRRWLELGLYGVAGVGGLLGALVALHG